MPSQSSNKPPPLVPCLIPARGRRCLPSSDPPARTRFHHFVGCRLVSPCCVRDKLTLSIFALWILVFPRPLVGEPPMPLLVRGRKKGPQKWSPQKKFESQQQQEPQKRRKKKRRREGKKQLQPTDAHMFWTKERKKECTCRLSGVVQG